MHEDLTQNYDPEIH